MTTRLSRESALPTARESAPSLTPRPAPSRKRARGAGATRPPTGSRVSRLRERRARFSHRRRMTAALWAIVFAGLGSATLVSSAAIANSPANSVVAYGNAPDLGSAAGIALHAGVVGIAGDPHDSGYWLVGSDGGVFAFGRAAFYGSTGDTHLNAPIVDIAATPSGHGYWLVGADGGVFAFGDAAYKGSIANLTLAAPIKAIVPTHDGRGYWLVGSDGGVFAFGDARFHGSAQGLSLASPIVGATATVTGHGYWLLGADGGVFAFGDADFRGGELHLGNPAVGIAASGDGKGYWIARADGSVSGFGTQLPGNATTVDTSSEHASTVGIAASGHGGYWLAQGPVDPASSLANDAFLACTRAHESDGAGGYTAVSAGGTYRGAYQFDRGTWNSAAALAGRTDLVGADPATVAPADQDLVAITLFHARGTRPWGGRCSGLT